MMYRVYMEFDKEGPNGDERHIRGVKDFPKIAKESAIEYFHELNAYMKENHPEEGGVVFAERLAFTTGVGVLESAKEEE